MYWVLIFGFISGGIGGAPTVASAEFKTEAACRAAIVVLNEVVRRETSTKPFAFCVRNDL